MIEVEVTEGACVQSVYGDQAMEGSSAQRLGSDDGKRKNQGPMKARALPLS
jgi:hypothetical protein